MLVRYALLCALLLASVAGQTSRAQACGDTEWGADCTKRCSSWCKSGPSGGRTCDVTTGACVQCEAGYKGDACNILCAPTEWGPRCTKSCPSQCQPQQPGWRTCNINTGACVQCGARWTGDTCETQENKQLAACASDRYGPNCTLNCSAGCQETQTGRKCHLETGHCACVAGRWGLRCIPTCSEGCEGGACQQSNGSCSCKRGWTGTKCSTTCSEGCEGGACQHRDGFCSCKRGWTGAKCDTECGYGWHGAGCTTQCGHCTDVQWYRCTRDGCSRCQTYYGCQPRYGCDRETGQCASCASGWQGKDCKAPCGQGRYGLNCSQGCTNCAGDGGCTPVSGACSQGCKPGYQPDYYGKCDNACTKGKYGQDCSQRCGNCAQGLSCHHVTGNCQCAAGFTGSDCSTKRPYVRSIANVDVTPGLESLNFAFSRSDVSVEGEQSLVNWFVWKHRIEQAKEEEWTRQDLPWPLDAEVQNIRMENLRPRTLYQVRAVLVDSESDEGFESPESFTDTASTLCKPARLSTAAGPGMELKRLNKTALLVTVHVPEDESAISCDPEDYQISSRTRGGRQFNHTLISLNQTLILDSEEPEGTLHIKVSDLTDQREIPAFQSNDRPYVKNITGLVVSSRQNSMNFAFKSSELTVEGNTKTIKGLKWQLRKAESDGEWSTKGQVYPWPLGAELSIITIPDLTPRTDYEVRPILVDSENGEGHGTAESFVFRVSTPCKPPDVKELSYSFDENTNNLKIFCVPKDEVGLCSATNYSVRLHSFTVGNLGEHCEFNATVTNTNIEYYWEIHHHGTRILEKRINLQASSYSHIWVPVIIVLIFVVVIIFVLKKQRGKGSGILKIFRFRQPAVSVQPEAAAAAEFAEYEEVNELSFLPQSSQKSSNLGKDQVTTQQNSTESATKVNKGKLAMNVNAPSSSKPTGEEYAEITESGQGYLEVLPAVDKETKLQKGQAGQKVEALQESVYEEVNAGQVYDEIKLDQIYDDVIQPSKFKTNRSGKTKQSDNTNVTVKGRDKVNLESQEKRPLMKDTKKTGESSKTAECLPNMNFGPIKPTDPDGKEYQNQGLGNTGVNQASKGIKTQGNSGEGQGKAKLQSGQDYQNFAAQKAGLNVTPTQDQCYQNTGPSSVTKEKKQGQDETVPKPDAVYYIMPCPAPDSP